MKMLDNNTDHITGLVTICQALLEQHKTANGDDSRKWFRSQIEYIIKEIAGSTQ